MIDKARQMLIILICVIILSPLLWNEILYFTGWKDSVSAPDNNAPVHFYVINLEKQPERLAKFNRQANKSGVLVERVSATDGYKIIFVDSETGEVFTGADIKSASKSFEPQHNYEVYCSSEGYNNKEAPVFIYKAFEALPRGLTIGEAGIACSTRLLWKKIAAGEKDQIAVIFEDDVILPDDFAQKFAHFIKALPEKWDIAYLSADLFKIRIHRLAGFRWKLGIPTLTVNNFFTKVHDQTNVEGIYAYAINKESALKLIEGHNKDTSVPVDYTIARMIQHRAITAYIAKDKMVAHDYSVASEISNMGRKAFGN